MGKKAAQDIIYSNKIIDVVKIDNMQTPKNVSRIICKDDDIKALHHTDGTVYSYTRTNMRTMFGKGINEGGSIGIVTEKIWCFLDIDNNRYIPMGKEETDFLYNTFYGNKKECKKDELAIISLYESGVLTKEEMKEAVSESGLACFLAAKVTFHEEYGYYPVKVPVYEFSAFPKEDEEAAEDTTARSARIQEYVF